MNAQRNNPSFFDKMLRPILVGIGVGLLICFGGLMLSAALIESVDIPNSMVFPLAMAAAGIGAFVAGLVAALLARQHGLLFGAICGLTLFLLILFAGFTRYAGVDGNRILIKLTVLVVTGSVGGILGVNCRKK